MDNHVYLSSEFFDFEEIKLLDSSYEGDSTIIFFIQLCMAACLVNNSNNIHVEPDKETMEKNFAEDFGMSRRTVACALSALTAAGIIEFGIDETITIKDIEKYMRRTA